MSPLPPTKDGRTKKALHVGANFFGKIYGRMFYMENNDQIIQRGI